MIPSLRASVAVLCLLLMACGGGSLTTYSTTVTNFNVTPGDAQVTVTWDAHPGQFYDLYFKVGSTVSLDNFDGLKLSITPPYTLINLTNQTQYAFILTATNSGGVAGPPTPVVTATPGSTGTGLSWTVNPPLAVSALRGVASGGNTVVAVGVPVDSTSPAIYSAQFSPTSTGGLSTWSPAQTYPPGLAGLTAVVFDGTQFVAMDSNGAVITSGDSVAWKLASTTGTSSCVPNKFMNGIAYGNGIYVAVGDCGYIATNTTSGALGAWVARASGTTNDLYGVAYLNGDFIAVGNLGTLLTSHDGVIWTARGTNTTDPLWQVAYGEGLYLAVGGNGTLLASADTVTWAQHQSPTTKDLYAIYFGGTNMFVAAGAGGTIAYSPSGQDGSWTLTGAGTQDLYGVTGGGAYVAVGAAGATVSGR